MANLISRGDIVIAVLCKPSQIRIGDIVLFKLRNKIKTKFDGRDVEVNYLAHRAVDRKILNGEGCFMQKGDMHFLASPMKYEEAAGKVAFIQKKDYFIDTGKLKWKMVNSIFAINAIVEYRLVTGLDFIFWFLPGKKRESLERKIIYLIRRPRRIIFSASLPLARKLFRKK